MTPTLVSSHMHLHIPPKTLDYSALRAQQRCLTRWCVVVMISVALRSVTVRSLIRKVVVISVIADIPSTKGCKLKGKRCCFFLFQSNSPRWNCHRAHYQREDWVRRRCPTISVITFSRPPLRPSRPLNTTSVRFFYKCNTMNVFFLERLSEDTHLVPVSKQWCVSRLSRFSRHGRMARHEELWQSSIPRPWEFMVSLTESGGCVCTELLVWFMAPVACHGFPEKQHGFLSAHYTDAQDGMLPSSVWLIGNILQFNFSDWP